MIRRSPLSFVLLLASVASFAQSRYDTTYYRAYKDKLILSLYQTLGSGFTLDFKQHMAGDTGGVSSPSYISEGNYATGFSLDYDVVSFSLDFKSTPPNDVQHKGKTTYSSYLFSFGGNRWTLETSYRSYKGFYDVNTARYDTNFKHTGLYYQDPDMRNRIFRGKIFFFFNNEKFAYKSAYTGIYRQLKSSATLLGVANVYWNDLRTDSSFFARPIQPYYGTLNDLNGLSVKGLSFCGGFSANLVIFEFIFINATFDIGPELQFRSYEHLAGGTAHRTYLGGAGDVRGAIGINDKNFYFTLTGKADVFNVKSGQMELKNTYGTACLNFGYRFGLRPPKIYKKFQQTKIYSYL